MQESCKSLKCSPIIFFHLLEICFMATAAGFKYFPSLGNDFPENEIELTLQLEPFEPSVGSLGARTIVQFGLQSNDFSDATVICKGRLETEKERETLSFSLGDPHRKKKPGSVALGGPYSADLAVYRTNNIVIDFCRTEQFVIHPWRPRVTLTPSFWQRPLVRNDKGEFAPTENPLTLTLSLDFSRNYLTANFPVEYREATPHQPSTGIFEQFDHGRSNIIITRDDSPFFSQNITPRPRSKSI